MRIECASSRLPQNMGVNEDTYLKHWSFKELHLCYNISDAGLGKDDQQTASAGGPSIEFT